MCVALSVVVCSFLFLFVRVFGLFVSFICLYVCLVCVFHCGLVS